MLWEREQLTPIEPPPLPRRGGAAVIRHDVIVVGAGVAGLRAALAANAAGVDVAVVSKMHPVRSASHAASGGILADEDVALTTRRVLDAGCGLADAASVDRVVREAPQAMRELERAGAVRAGALVGHRLLQTLHGLAGRAGITFYEDLHLLDLVAEGGRCLGIVCWDLVHGRATGLSAQATVIATGGMGRAFAATSNPRAATGDGTAAAWRAGIAIRDMEFVQFVEAGAHIQLGGIDVDADGRSTLLGLYAAGEAACAGAHGAGIVDGAALAEAIVLGGAAGTHAAGTVVDDPGDDVVPEFTVRAAERRVLEQLGTGSGERPSVLARELRSVMSTDAGAVRNEAGLARALERVQALRERARSPRIDDRSRRCNTALVASFELQSLLALSECVVVGALARDESRGVHVRSDHAARDDARFARHTLSWFDAEQVRLDYSALVGAPVGAR